MSDIALEEIEPYEICSIRPPTENYSLTFRLTRNCYWNKCRFCPVYKFGASFSKRSIEDVNKDIERAKRIDDLLTEYGIGLHPYAAEYDNVRVLGLIEEIEKRRKMAGKAGYEEEDISAAEIDPRLSWFLSWFKDKPKIKHSIQHILTWRMYGRKTCFIGDSDSLILKPDYLAEAISSIKASFPSLDRFTIYGRTKSASRLRSINDLQILRNTGLERVHFGLESGSDKVLELVNKGVTGADHIEGCLKIKEAGLSCSVYVMPGLGGIKYSEEHARQTAKVITQIAPDYIRLRTLIVFPQTPLEEMAAKGEFIECDDEKIVRELKIMIEEIDSETEIVSDSASNLLNLYGKLPLDREDMLQAINNYLVLDEREKLIFGLQSRLEAFRGQYGGFTDDIVRKLQPFIVAGKIDLSRATNDAARDVTMYVRSKLMP